MAVSDYIPLNTSVMSNPFNWVIVFLMVAIAGLAISLIANPPTATAEE